MQADVDKSGTIDYDEFIAATVHLNKLEREEHLLAAFAYFDRDGSGYITVDELEHACWDHNMADVGIDDIIREVDQDNVLSPTSIQRHLPSYLHYSFIQFVTICRTAASTTASSSQ